MCTCESLAVLGEASGILGRVKALLACEACSGSRSRLVHAQAWMDARLVSIEGEIASLRAQKLVRTVHRCPFLKPRVPLFVRDLLPRKTVAIRSIPVVKVRGKLALLDVLDIFRLRSCPLVDAIVASDVLKCVNILIVCHVAHVLSLGSLVLSI